MQHQRGPDDGGRCEGHDRGWGEVPIGCSMKSGHDWAPHWKSWGANCPGPHYQLICRGGSDVNIYLAGKGQKICPGGGRTLHGRDDCRDDCEAAVTLFYSKSGKGSTRGFQEGGGGGGGWGAVPKGCSVQSGGDWTAHFKSWGPNSPDRKYQLVCVSDVNIYPAGKGAKNCPGAGRSPRTEHECKTAAALYYAKYGKSSRRGLQVGEGGVCNDRSWGFVPIGCSVQSGGDWTVFLKLSGVNCPSTGYQLLCVE